MVTVPISSTLAVMVDDDCGQLTIVSPSEAELKWNVKKAIEAVAGLIRETPDYQLVILAVLLLWARKYGSAPWQEYCNSLLPPHRELSCLLCYTPGELSALQLPHLVDEASRQHDWARWTHTSWTSSASGALRRLGLAEDVEETAWALAAVRSRAVEFPLGLMAPGGGKAADTAAAGRGAERSGPFLSVLAPVIDLANHSPDPNCVIQLTTDRSRVVLLPRRPIPAGEPLTVDYGFSRSSLELMADYGFVTTANRHDGWMTLPGADKLPPLELPRLQAAARALQRRRRRLQQLQQRQMGQLEQMARGTPGADAARGAGAEAQAGGDSGRQDQEVEVVGEDEEDGDEEVLSLGDVQAEAEEDACFSARLSAAVSLLSPRYTSPGASNNYSTPATQRIVAGLWHKLTRHTAESLPTSLEQDMRLLYDIEAGRVSGFGAGPSMYLDPAAPKIRQLPGGAAAGAEVEAADGLAAEAAAESAAGGGMPGQGVARAPPGGGEGGEAAQSVSGAAAGAAAAPPDDGARPGTRGAAASPAAAGAEQSTPPQQPASAASAAGAGAGTHAPAGSESAAHCRTGRRVGRLYAALRARMEHKELLAVAEELLLQYGRG